MNLIIITIFIFLTSSIRCCKNFYDDEPDLDGPIEAQPEPIDFGTTEMMEQFLTATQSFEAFNLKKKYELGKLITMIINTSKMESVETGSAAKKPKINYEEEAVAEPDVIDKNPVESWRIAETYMKVYKEKGWKDIKKPLKSEPVYVRSKLVVRAITDEEVSLVKRLVTEKYTYITIDRFNYAVRNYKEKGTVKCEEIIDFIAKKNPELGTAVNMRTKLELGLNQIQVHDYIYANNYPMLRRALDEGFDPNFTFKDRGSLLGLSVIAKCYRCVKMLIERGADVNAPILLDDVVMANGWGKIAVPVGWTPLMMAVADGNVRIITELIESGNALVSKTGNGKEGERFHAREVARRIPKDELRSEILKSLMLNDREMITLKDKVKETDFIKAIYSKNMYLIDTYLLLNPNLKLIPGQISINEKYYNEVISDLLASEIITVEYTK